MICFLLFEKYYHYTIYSIILIGVHRTAEPFTLSIHYHLKYSFYREYFRSSINYIAYIPKLRGYNIIFVISIKNCKCSILKLGLLLFDLPHQYLYALLIFSFCEIRNSEKYRVIVGYSLTPGWQVSAISYKYYHYFWIHISYFIVIHYLVFIL